MNENEKAIERIAEKITVGKEERERYEKRKEKAHMALLVFGMILMIAEALF